MTRDDLVRGGLLIVLGGRLRRCRMGSSLHTRELREREGRLIGGCAIFSMRRWGVDLNNKP